MQKGGPLRSRYTTRAKAEIRNKKRWRLKRGDQGSQPVLVVHKSSTLDPTSPPAPHAAPPPRPLLRHGSARTHADRQRFSRAHTNPPYVFIQFLIPPRRPLAAAPLCFSSLHLFPSFSLLEHPFSLGEGEPTRGRGSPTQVSYRIRVNARFPAKWLPTKSSNSVAVN